MKCEYPIHFLLPPLKKTLVRKPALWLISSLVCDMENAMANHTINIRSKFVENFNSSYK